MLIGFNSVDAARDIRIEKWDKTCKEVGCAVAIVTNTFCNGVSLSLCVFCVF